MLHPLPPAEAYRRVQLDAWIAGGDARQLTRICLAEAVGALGRALLWHDRGDGARRSGALGKALSCTQALRLGVDGTQPLGGALLVVYGDTAARLARSLGRFDREGVQAVRDDLLELEQAFNTA